MSEPIKVEEAHGPITVKCEHELYAVHNGIYGTLYETSSGTLENRKCLKCGMPEADVMDEMKNRIIEERWPTTKQKQIEFPSDKWIDDYCNNVFKDNHSQYHNDIRARLRRDMKIYIDAYKQELMRLNGIPVNLFTRETTKPIVEEIIQSNYKHYWDDEESKHEL